MGGKKAFVFAVRCFAGAALCAQEAAPVPNPEAAIALNFGAPAAGDAGAAMTTVSAWPVVRAILAFGVIILALYGFYRFMKKQHIAPEDDNPFLKRLCSVPLGTNKSAQILTLGGDRAVLVGVADSAVNLLVEITDKELVDALNVYASEQAARKRQSFGALLDMFRKGKSYTKGTEFGVTEGTERNLKGQLERLRGGNA